MYVNLIEWKGQRPGVTTGHYSHGHSRAYKQDLA